MCHALKNLPQLTNVTDWLRWLPAPHRKPLLQRLLIVWAVALPIALATWLGHPADQMAHRLDVSLVYAYAISTAIWLLTDVSRYAFKGLLHAQAPHFWPPAGRAALMLSGGIAVGYVVGTWVGDAYAGVSTWALWQVRPLRLVGLLATSLAISAGFVVFFYQRAKADALAQQVTQAKLMLLQSQLEPHMLFNTLAHLRALIAQDSAGALAMLDHLDDYLRTTLRASQQALHPLANELERLRDYLSLMAIRMGPRMAFELDWPASLAQLPVPSFILQPLVENAIRHGLEPAPLGGRICVQARADATHLLLTVHDDGQGMSELALAEWGEPLDTADFGATSWGLRHVRQRLQALYGTQAAMHVDTGPAHTGTRVVLRLPLGTLD